ncbi:MAG: dTDP-4-dehydrorhamnose reductase [Coriobacteriales bacterium]|nr:dTDP-4-dehydrorhamnose reductase [Coriobacteriales bacterium]
MKILIVGEGGQLGNELQEILRTGQAQIGPIPAEYKDAELVCPHFEDFDASDKESVDAMINGAGFDLIINCAAYTAVDAAEDNVLDARAGNVVIPQLLAMAADANNCKLVHISTDYVFNGQGTRPYLETDQPAPKSVYGITKLEGERMVQNFCWRHFIMRTSWLYGQVGNNFVKTITAAARKNGKVKVVNDQLGNPTNANDLAYEILKVALTDNYGVYHCTNNGICSWYDFTCEILRLTGIEAECEPCSSDEFPAKAPRPAYSALENQKLAQTIGDEMRDWKDAIANYCEIVKL